MSILDDMAALVRQAGQIVLSARDIWSHTHEKTSAADLVTEYDEAVEAFLKERLPGLLSAIFLSDLQARGISLSVTHQCGKGNSAALEQLISALPASAKPGFAYRACDFIDDMAAAYAHADLLICRAGALTVAEAAAAGMPALYVPLPTAVDDHQTKNAASQVQKGGAALIAQADLTEDKLRAQLLPLCTAAELTRRSDCQKQAALLDAPELILKEIYALLEAKKHQS